MDVLMLNQKWFKLTGATHAGFKYPHSSMTRNILLAHHMAKLDGVSVWFQTADPVPPAHPFTFTWWDGKKKDFDVVVTIQDYPLRDNPEWRSHPFVVMFGDQAPDPAVKVFFVDSLALKPKYTKEHRKIRIEQGVWGVTDWPDAPDPYPDHNKPIVFYAGYVYIKETIDFLNRLAEVDDFQTWAVLSVNKDLLGAQWNRGMTDAEREKFLSPKLRLASDLVGHGKFGHGQLEHGTFTGFLQHADVGICPGQGDTKKPVTFCKTYEYLGNGLPVIIDSRISDCPNVLKIPAGKMFDYKSHSSLVAAIHQELAEKRDRRMIRQKAVELWGWETIAKNFLHIVTEELGKGGTRG